MKINKVCVLGLGYIGLPTACELACHGVKVLGVDINPAVITTLKNGGIHIHEPGLRAVVQEAVKSNNLKVSDRAEPADVFYIAVPTPFLENEHGNYQGVAFKLADMAAVEAATTSILPVLRRGNLVVLESTSPPRTTLELVAPILERSGMRAGVDFHLVYSPERVLPGQILRELVENARVVGGVTSASARAGKSFYSIFVKGEIILTDATTAEMVKLMENTYRDVNIAIANEFTRLADRFGVDIWEAISLANRHPRVKILNPGPGVGGHCISVDPWFLVQGAPDLARLIHQSRQVNDEQPHFVLELVKRSLGKLKGKTIAALGLSYKPNVDDLRESPAIEVIRLLQSAGAKVKAFEPFKPDAVVKGLSLYPDLEMTLKDVDAVLLLVAHGQFSKLTPGKIASLSDCRILIDTVNGWKGASWAKSGFTLHKLGSNIRNN